MSTQRTFPRVLAVFAAIPLVFAACTSAATPSPSAAPSVAPTAAPPSAASAPASSASAPASAATGPSDALIAAAKAEGNLTTIALPHNWCDYGDMLTGFTAKYGIKINELNPDGGSGDEIAAIEANKGSTGPSAPDVIDVGLSFGPQAKTAGDIQPYKVSTWNDIPDNAKDADGYWYGDYYGVMSFEVNTSIVTDVPKDWSDLLKPEYKGEIALAGDPTVSNQAISAVWAAGIATGGSLDNAQPGLDFFKQLNTAGNLVPVIGKTATMVNETPIRLAWSYNALSDKASLAGNPPITVVVPTSGRFGGMYVQAISKYAPHPNAAKLWMEYLYSDVGQNTWLKGFCNPIRYTAMVAAGTVDPVAQAALPDTTGAVLPTLDQITKATDVITKGWPTAVGATIK